MQEHQRILLTKMINIWEIRPRCLETAPAAQLQGDGWHSFPQPRIQESKILPAAHLGSGQQTLPECKGYSTEGQGKERSSQSRWEESCWCLQQGQNCTSCWVLVLQPRRTTQEPPWQRQSEKTQSSDHQDKSLVKDKEWKDKGIAKQLSEVIDGSE